MTDIADAANLRGAETEGLYTPDMLDGMESEKIAQVLNHLVSRVNMDVERDKRNHAIRVAVYIAVGGFVVGVLVGVLFMSVISSSISKSVDRLGATMREVSK